jgi:hypothetical protein
MSFRELDQTSFASSPQARTGGTSGSRAPSIGQSLCGTPLGRSLLSKPWVGENSRGSFRYDQLVGKNPASASVYPTLRQTWPRVVPEAAMCVRKISAQCVLQFTPSNAFRCALHRRTSRVIHRQEYLLIFCRVYLPVLARAQPTHRSVVVASFTDLRQYHNEQLYSVTECWAIPLIEWDQLSEHSKS